MSIEFACSGCQKTLRVTTLSAGKQARCPACGAISQVPVAAAVGAEVLGPPSPGGISSPPVSQRLEKGDNPFSRAAPAKPDANPYVFPAAVSPFAYSGNAARRLQLPLASRGTRLLGAILDGLIHLVGFIPGALLAGVMALAGADEDAAFGVFVVSMLVGFLVALGVAIYNWVLISKTGQSIAKRMLHMRIVRKDTGELPGFLHGVLLRSWVPALINEACNLFGLIDALWIFGQECRCVHDLIADTIVVDVRGEMG